MKLFHIFALIFATTPAFVLSSFLLPNTEIEGRITHGKNATEGQFPYQVGISIDNYYWCGGCLIGTEWVLTAAHCLSGFRDVSVFLGSTVREQAEQERHVTNINYIIHHDFNSETFRDDIALIKIPSVSLSANIQPIKLPSIFKKMHSTYTNKFATASGWGRFSDEQVIVAKYLQWARLQIIPNEDCGKKLSFTIPKSSLCVATPNGTSPCFGDSGGPLVSETDQTLIGVFSFLSELGCELGYPVAFVRLTNYLDWIYYHTGIFY